MQANELRIGNYVYSKSFEEIRQVGEINSRGSVSYIRENTSCYDGTSFKDDAQPIVLTEEWLIRLGFRSYTDTNPCIENQNIYRNGKLAIEYRMKSFRVLWYDANDDYGTSICLVVNYIHQLQNLYFALTRNELTIKL